MSTPAPRRGIVVGVDGSPPSKVAVDWAARDAALRKIPLTVVNVLEPVMLMPATLTVLSAAAFLSAKLALVLLKLSTSLLMRLAT